TIYKEKSILAYLQRKKDHAKDIKVTADILGVTTEQVKGLQGMPEPASLAALNALKDKQLGVRHTPAKVKDDLPEFTARDLHILSGEQREVRIQQWERECQIIKADYDKAMSKTATSHDRAAIYVTYGLPS